MFCSGCGEELDNDAIYCKQCGKKIKVENTTKDKSMKYSDFFSKYYLKFVIIRGVIGIGILFNYNDKDIYTIGAIAINILLYIVLPFLLTGSLEKRKKFDYNLLISFLIIDYIYRILNVSLTTFITQNGANLVEYIILSALFWGIWYIPNFIYFAKRKQMFIND